MTLSVAVLPLARQRRLKMRAEFGKALQAQTATNGEQPVMQVFRIGQPARFFAICGGKIPLHPHKIFLMQTRHPQVERILHHRDGRLRHAIPQALRQMVSADHTAFIFQHPARRIPLKQSYRQRVFKARLGKLWPERAAK